MGLDANRITGSKIYSRRPSKYSLYGSATVCGARVSMHAYACYLRVRCLSTGGSTNVVHDTVFRSQCTGLKSQLTHAISISSLFPVGAGLRCSISHPRDKNPMLGYT